MYYTQYDIEFSINHGDISTSEYNTTSILENCKGNNLE